MLRPGRFVLFVKDMFLANFIVVYARIHHFLYDVSRSFYFPLYFIFSKIAVKVFHGNLILGITEAFPAGCSVRNQVAGRFCFTALFLNK